MIGDTLIIDLFEVNKEYRHKGIGGSAMERLMLETGAKKVMLDAKDNNAERFWSAIGMKKVDEQTYVFD
jgi:predicted GNAT family acetyltransferase